jgi:hypothetical protein
MDTKSPLTLPPTPGNVWRINMFRMDVPQGKPQQASGWSPPLIGDFHALDRFGELVFGDAEGAVPPPAPPAEAKAPVAAKEKTGGGAGTVSAPADHKAAASTKGGGGGKKK